jgi:protein-histidine pros-kinase
VFAGLPRRSSARRGVREKREGVKLLTKFNLILVVLFGSGMALISRLAYDFLMQDARAQVLQQAQLMVESARATRDYTAEELEPLLVDVPDAATTFLPQTIPFYSATQIFARLRKQFPEYTYKEAALNPMNLRDRAVDWEADVINQFRNHPEQKEMVGERETPAGKALYLAHPIAADDTCLGCHGLVDQAMPTVVKTYGSVNGFGWKQNEVIGAQIVSVPMTVPVRIADQAFRRLMFNLAGIFLVTLTAIDFSLYFIVTRPVRRLAVMADRISKGEMDLTELPVKGRDEIAGLTQSFNRMFVSLVKAFKLLKG